MDKIWKEWWKESFKAVPLLIAVLLIALKSIMAGIASGIIVLYIAHLYDLKWRIKLNKMRRSQHKRK